MRIHTDIVNETFFRWTQSCSLRYCLLVGEVEEVEDVLLSAEVGQCRFACHIVAKG